MGPAVPFVVLAVAGASPYRVDFVMDSVATFGAFAVTGVSELLVKPSLGGGITCESRTPSGRCDPDDLVWPDSTVVGNHSETWLFVSDVGAAASYVLPMVVNAIDIARSGSPSPMLEWSTDALVIAEAVALSTLLTHTLKLAYRRPRPTQYREGAYVGSSEHQLSFPSGHSSSAAAAAAAYAVTFGLRHPDSPWRWIVAAAAVGVSGLTGYSRIAGGMHFYSDVLAGVMIGAASGIIVPLLHVNEASVAPMVAASGARTYGAVVTLAI